MALGIHPAGVAVAGQSRRADTVGCRLGAPTIGRFKRDLDIALRVQALLRGVEGGRRALHQVVGLAVLGVDLHGDVLEVDARGVLQPVGSLRPRCPNVYGRSSGRCRDSASAPTSRSGRNPAATERPARCPPGVSVEPGIGRRCRRGSRRLPPAGASAYLAWRYLQYTALCWLKTHLMPMRPDPHSRHRRHLRQGVQRAHRRTVLQGHPHPRHAAPGPLPASRWRSRP